MQRTERVGRAVLRVRRLAGDKCVLGEDTGVNKRRAHVLHLITGNCCRGVAKAAQQACQLALQRRNMPSTQVGIQEQPPQPAGGGEQVDRR